jgi:hypothetical protein
VKRGFAYPEPIPLTPATMPEKKRIYPPLKSAAVGGVETWSKIFVDIISATMMPKIATASQKMTLDSNVSGCT